MRVIIIMIQPTEMFTAKNKMINIKYLEIRRSVSQKRFHVITES